MTDPEKPPRGRDDEPTARSAPEIPGIPSTGEVPLPPLVQRYYDAEREIDEDLSHRIQEGLEDEEKRRRRMVKRYLEAEREIAEDSLRQSELGLQEERQRRREQLQSATRRPAAEDSRGRVVGVWGQKFLDSLRENRPETYRSLQGSGDLESMAAEIEERAQSQFQTLMASFRQHNPPKPEWDYLQRVQHEMVLASQVRELVLDDLLVPEPEDEPATDADDTDGTATTPHTD